MHDTPVNRLWLLHDIPIGIVSGGGAGLILGLMLSARLSHNDLVAWIVAAVGASLGIFALVRSHRARERFFTWMVALAWGVLALSILFIMAVASAISSFN